MRVSPCTNLKMWQAPVLTNPCDMFCKSTTNDRAKDSANSVHAAKQAEPFTSLSEGYHVTNHNLSHDDHTSTTSTLNGSGDEQCFEILRTSAADTPSEKKGNRAHQDIAATNEGRYAADDWLKDCGTQQEASARPE